MHEEWKDVVGYEGYYRVSSLGRILSLARVIISKSGIPRKIPSRIIAHGNRPNGYLFYSLSKNGYSHPLSAHVLVASHFIEGRRPGYQVNHKDGNKRNNRIENLEWVTPQENVDHSISTGLKGHIPSLAVIAFSGNTIIGRFVSCRAAALALNVDPGHICRILKGTLRTSKGYTFKVDKDGAAREMGAKKSRHVKKQ